MSRTPHNVDASEVAKFSSLAGEWWNPDGDFKTLHEINPLRLEFVETHAGSLAGRRVLDVGCGGGILAEGLARRGAHVMGVDATESAIAVAHQHLRASDLQIDYRLCTIEELVLTHPQPFDVVTCMELLEHVPDPASVVRSCAALAAPDGHVFFSTINRNPKAYALAILGAEYLLRLLPVGTHDYAKFIRPSELDAWARDAGLDLGALRGIAYHPLTKRFRTTAAIDVNYLAWFRR